MVYSVQPALALRLTLLSSIRLRRPLHQLEDASLGGLRGLECRVKADVGGGFPTGRHLGCNRSNDDGDTGCHIACTGCDLCHTLCHTGDKAGLIHRRNAGVDALPLHHRVLRIHCCSQL